MANDIATVITVPEDVQVTLRNACYNCHSNNTDYPWYANIQPVGWYLTHHVKEGTAELNFNEFGSYTRRKQIRKLKSIASQVRDGEMPPALMHGSARLTQAQQTRIMTWASTAADSLSLRL